MPITPSLTHDLSVALRQELAPRALAIEPESQTYHPGFLSVFDKVGPALKQAIVAFLHHKGSRSVHTAKAYNRQLARFFLWFGYLPEPTLDEQTLSAYQRELLNPSDKLLNHPDLPFGSLSRESIDIYMQPVRSFCRYLATINALPYNPALLVPGLGKVDAEHDERRAFSKEQWSQVHRALNAMPNETPGQRNTLERLRFTFDMGFSMALRVGEQSSTTHGNVYSRDGTWRLEVVGKGRKVRRRRMDYFDTIAIDSVKRYRAFLNLSELPIAGSDTLSLLPSAAPVLMHTRTGEPLGTIKPKSGVGPRAWQQHFKSFIQNTVLPHCYPDKTFGYLTEIYQSEWSALTPHSLRHTRVTQLQQDGFDPFIISKFVGHANLDTTRIYVDNPS